MHNRKQHLNCLSAPLYFPEPFPVAVVMFECFWRVGCAQALRWSTVVKEAKDTWTVDRWENGSCRWHEPTISSIHQSPYWEDTPSEGLERMGFNYSKNVLFPLVMLANATQYMKSSDMTRGKKSTHVSQNFKWNSWSFLEISSSSS